MAALARKPSGQAAVLVVVLEKQHFVARPRQLVGTGQSAQAAANDDYVIFVCHSF